MKFAALIGAAAPAIAAVTNLQMTGMTNMPGTYMSARTHTLLQQDGNASLPEGGSIWPTGVFWVLVEVGTPAVTFPVAIDSGSGDLDIEGAGCSGCSTKAPNAQYDLAKSSTGSTVFPYTFSNTYETCDLTDIEAPCTIKGSLFRDQVSVGGLGPVQVEFGSITKIDTNFDQFREVCGVMGFIGNGPKTVFAQLYKGGHVDENVYALCINQDPTHGSNGTLTLGGVDQRLASGPITYVPNTNPFFYEVAIRDISVGGRRLANVPANAILDTGTNINLFPTALYNSFSDSIKSLCSTTNLRGVCDSEALARGTLFEGECFNLSEQDVAQFPTVTFALNNDLMLTLNPIDYLVNGDVRAKGDKSLTCLAVRSTKSLFIIGDTLMRNYYLVFDRAGSRIGWAPVNKQACGNISF